MEYPKRIINTVENLYTQIITLRNEINSPETGNNEEIIRELLPQNFSNAMQRGITKYVFIKTILLNEPRWKYGYNKTIRIVNTMIEENIIKTKRVRNKVFVFKFENKQSEEIGKMDEEEIKRINAEWDEQ